MHYLFSRLNVSDYYHFSIRNTVTSVVIIKEGNYYMFQFLWPNHVKRPAMYL
jgi:hypothetical protein